MSTQPPIIGALEIGTSTIKIVVGAFDGGKLSILGHAECPSVGILKGTIIDFDRAKACLDFAIMTAEQNAGMRIDRVLLALTGGHLEGFCNEVQIDVSGANNHVGQFDIETVCRLAKAKELPEGRTAVQFLQRPFRLDGHPVSKPELLSGRKLEVGYWVMHGSARRISNSIQIMNGFNLQIDDIILSSLAAGTMVTTMEERQSGTLVIDIGAGTTDYVLYRDNCAYMAGVLTVGGGHLTNDLALGLRVQQGQAETLKLRYGRGVMHARDKKDKVMLIGNFSIGDREFPRLTIEQIAAARVWEIFEVVRKKLGAAFAPEKIPAGVVLTGGAAKLPAITEAAAKVFGMSARLGEAPLWIGENLRDPGYSTTLGLLHCEIPGGHVTRTLNSDIGDLDSALLRPERLITHRDFRPLTPDEAKTDRNLFEGYDLDVPTYRRKGIEISL